MQTYFIRQNYAVRPEEMIEMFDRDLIGIHYPDFERTDSRSLDPEDYRESNARSAVKYLNRLGREGGYVWAEYKNRGEVKIGIVEPGTPIQLEEFHWRRASRHEDRKREEGDPAIIKALPLQVAYTVDPHELISFRAARPPGATICHWNIVDDRLKRVIDKGTLPFTWRSMSPSQLEMAWSEFLRTHKRDDLPHLQYLWMPPGRTLKDVDLYGVTRSGTPLYGQVTYKSRASSSSKIDCLRVYEGSGNELLFFCDCDGVERSNRVTFVPNSLLDQWMEANRPHSEGLVDRIA